MILAQELRIKNLVMVNGEIEEIFGICEDYPFLKTAKYGACVIEYKDLEPITLTEDLLLKLGFVKQDNNWKTLDLIFATVSWERLAGFTLSFEKESIYLPHIKFVHQLQNLYFALENQELKIT